MNELINNFINSYPKKDNYSKEDVTKIMQAFSANVQNSVKNNIDFQMKDLMISKDLFQFIKDQIYFFKEISERPCFSSEIKNKASKKIEDLLNDLLKSNINDNK